MSPLTQIDVDTITIDVGVHYDPDAGKACVMEWVSLAAGEEFSDRPACTSQVIGALLRTWNDVLNDGDRQQLRRYIPVIDSDGVVISDGVMGTAGSAEIEDIRAWMACDWLIRTYAPAWLRLAGLSDQADMLARLDEVTAATLLPARAVIDVVRRDAVAAGEAAARDAAWGAARVAARATAGDAAESAAGVAGDAARVAVRVVRDAGGDAAEAAARAAGGAALRPTVVELQRSTHNLIGRMIAASTNTSTEGDTR